MKLSPMVYSLSSLRTVARSRQVYIECLEATVLYIYLPRVEENVYMYIRPTFLPEAAFAA
jgi:hypothetical protein